MNFELLHVAIVRIGGEIITVKIGGQLAFVELEPLQVTTVKDRGQLATGKFGGHPWASVESFRHSNINVVWTMHISPQCRMFEEHATTKLMKWLHFLLSSHPSSSTAIVRSLRQLPQPSAVVLVSSLSAATIFNSLRLEVSSANSFGSLRRHLCSPAGSLLHKPFSASEAAAS